MSVSRIALLTHKPILFCWGNCKRVVHLDESDRVCVCVCLQCTHLHLFAILKVFITVAQIPGGINVVFCSLSSSFLYRRSEVIRATEYYMTSYDKMSIMCTKYVRNSNGKDAYYDVQDISIPVAPMEATLQTYAILNTLTISVRLYYILRSSVDAWTRLGQPLWNSAHKRGIRSESSWPNRS